MTLVKGCRARAPRDSRTSWADGTLVGFDTETTNPDPMTARIVSASVVVDTPGEELQVGEWLINPHAPIDLEATAIHGISNEHAERFGVEPEQGVREIIDALAAVDSPVVVVNAAFDFTILIQEAKRYGYDALPVIEKLHIIDTLVCDRWLDKYRPGRRSLTATAASYGIAIRGAHTATGDVHCAIRLARAMAAKFPSFATSDLGALRGIQARAFSDWAENFQEFNQMEDPGFTVPTDWPYRLA
jgi:DNA polymerase III subunit epsilon